MLNAADNDLLAELSARAEGGNADRLAAKRVLESIRRQPGRIGRSFSENTQAELAEFTQPGDPPSIVAPRLSVITLLTSWDQPAYIASRQLLGVEL